MFRSRVMVLGWFLFYGPSTHFRSFRVRSVTQQHCSWAGLLGSLPVFSAHSFASNWQLLFLNQRKRENGRRIFSWPSLHERMCRTSGLKSGRLHAKRTRFRSSYRALNIYVYIILKKCINDGRLTDYLSKTVKFIDAISKLQLRCYSAYRKKKKKKKKKSQSFVFFCPLVRLGELSAVIAIATSPNIKLEVLSQEVPQ